MAGVTATLAADLLATITGVSTWLGVSTTTPDSSGGNVTEPAGFGRVEILPAQWTTVDREASTNVDRSITSAAAGTVVPQGWVLFSASTGDDVLLARPITGNGTTAPGATLTFDAGALVVSA